MSDKIKIIHFISSLSRGGRERQLANIVTNNDFEKYSTRIIYLNDVKNSYMDEYDLKKYAVKVNKKGFIARILILNKILIEYQPDIVITWGNIESIFILLLKPFHKFVFINGSVRHGIRSKKISHYFRTIILHLSHNVVANSHAGLKANKLKKGFVLYNGIDDKFLKPLINRNECRKKLINISDDIPLLISVANLVPYKDYISILDALKRLRDDSVNFYYLILGDGPMKQEILQSIRAYALDKYVQIIGHTENVFDYLKISDLFIHSSKGEGCSNAILEAMAAGLPIIGTNTGGTNEVVTSNNGWLFEFKDTKQLLILINNALKDLRKLKHMGNMSQKIIIEKFTIEKMMSNYFKMVNQFASTQRKKN